MVFSAFNFLRSPLTLEEVTDKMTRKKRSIKPAFPSMPTQAGPRQPLPLEAPPGPELCFCLLLLPPAPQTQCVRLLALHPPSPSARPPPSTYLCSLSWPLSRGDTLCPGPEDDHRHLLNFSILATAPEEMGSFLPAFSSETCFGVTSF